MDNHLKTIFIILIVAVTFLCINLNCKEHFYVNLIFKSKSTKPQMKKLFNIDSEIAANNNSLGWKSFWRKNYSKYDDNLNNIYKNPEYTPFKQKLLYDGIRHLKTPF